MRVLTLLAQGTRYALLGDRAGMIFRISAAALTSIRDTLDAPKLRQCPPDTAPRVGSSRAVVDRSLPPEVVLKFEYRTDFTSGITIYCAFESGSKAWYLRELRDNEGHPTGNYHSEGGA